MKEGVDCLRNVDYTFTLLRWNGTWEGDVSACRLAYSGKKGRLAIALVSTQRPKMT